MGAGQLARMAGEAASALGLSMAVLAERPDDAACAVAAEVVLGSPLVESDLRALAARCDVVTFDHEQVDLAVVRSLGADGVVVRPGVATLELAVDKATMRRVLGDHGIAMPAHVVVELTESGPRDGAEVRPDSPTSTDGPSCSRRPGAATTARGSGRSTDLARRPRW